MAKKLTPEQQEQLKEKLIQDPKTRDEIRAVEIGEKSSMVVAVRHKAEAEKIYEKTKRARKIEHHHMDEFQKEITKATYFASMPVERANESNQSHILEDIGNLETKYKGAISKHLKDTPYKS